MRVFVALNLPAAERKRIHRAAAPLRERELPVRWADLDSFHVTLKFLGDVRSEALDRINQVLGAAAGENAPFEMDLGGFGAFPTIRRPRVFWLGADASPALRCLKQDVEWGLAELGFDRETRAFHPHVTLGRVNQEEGAGVFRGVDELTASLDYTSSVAVRSVDLMRSELGKDGARYSVLESHRLGA